MSSDAGSAVVRHDEIRRHLELLYSSSCEDLGTWFNIFTLHDRESRFFREVGDEVVAYCAEKAEAGREVYCCMGTFAQPVAGGGRGRAGDVVALSAFWADVDVLHEQAHKAKSYPTTVEEALEVCRVSLHPPSFHVHSGYGVHAYWLLNEPMEVVEARRRNDATILLKRWQGTLQSRAKAMGFEVDATHDPVRVLRVAGTINWKDKDNPKPVVMTCPDRPTEYDPDTMEEVMVAVEYVSDQGAYRSLAEVSDFRLDPNATIDDKILSAARANDETFRDTWDRRRDDFSDDSASTYDFALANHFVRAGFDDQTIVDALIHWRRLHGCDPKLRVDYYQRTIGKVRATTEQAAVVSKIADGVHDLPEVSDVSMLSSDERDNFLRDIRAVLRINVARFIQVNVDNAIFFFELDNGERFSVGDIDNVLEYRKMRARLAERMGVLIDNDILKNHWKGVTSRLFAIRESEDTSELTTAQSCRALLVEYFEQAKLYDEEEWQLALRENSPFVREGNVHVHADTFVNWAGTSRKIRFTKSEALRDFKLLGMTNVQVTGRDRGDRKNRWYWSIGIEAFSEVFIEEEVVDG